MNVNWKYTILHSLGPLLIIFCTNSFQTKFQSSIRNPKTKITLYTHNYDFFPNHFWSVCLGSCVNATTIPSFLISTRRRICQDQKPQTPTPEFFFPFSFLSLIFLLKQCDPKRILTLSVITVSLYILELFNIKGRYAKEPPLIKIQ